MRGHGRMGGGVWGYTYLVEEHLCRWPGQWGWPSVKVSRFTSPADEIAAKAAQRMAEARIEAGRKRMKTRIFNRELGLL